MQFSTVSNMLAGLVDDSFQIEDHFAWLMYESFCKLHELVLHRLLNVSLNTGSQLITWRTELHVKLHWGTVAVVQVNLLSNKTRAK